MMSRIHTSHYLVHKPFVWHLFTESWQKKSSIQGNFEVPNFPAKNWNDKNLSELWKIQTSKIMVNFKQILKNTNYVTIWNSSHLRPNFLSLKNKSEISKISHKKLETGKIDTFKLQNILVIISSKSRVKTTKWRILGKSINYFNSR